MCQNKVAKILDWPIPATPKEVRSLLGITSFYRRFERNFSKIAKPLLDLTRQKMVFNWGAAQNQAFEILKRAFCNAPVITII